MKFNRWHRLLVFLGLRNQFDYAPPGLGPEVNHPYFKHDALQCCNYCGGGPKHPIHSEPHNERRAAEVVALELERNKSRYQKAVDSWVTNDATDFRAYVEREH